MIANRLRSMAVFASGIAVGMCIILVGQDIPHVANPVMSIMVWLDWLAPVISVFLLLVLLSRSKRH